MVSQSDIQYMQSAISLARRGIGRTAENPSVGCVVVKGGHVIGRGRTSDGGRPHAERKVLEQLGESAFGATLYVTLEPCTHHGKTPPCTEAIIDAGIKRVVIGAFDSDPRVKGKSVSILQDAGIEVVTSVLSDQCRAVNIGFFSRIERQRPYITIKTACTLDGKIATSTGDSQWITGALARKSVHQLRSRHDAILVGVETVLADDPALTTRIRGVGHKSARIILDTALRTPLDSQLVKTANDMPVHIFYTQDTDDRMEGLKSAGLYLHHIPKHDLSAVVQILADLGINRLMVEGGASVQTSFLRQGLCDELHIYRAPTCIGSDGLPVLQDMDIDTLSKRLDVHAVSRTMLGQDCLEIYKTDNFR